MKDRKRNPFEELVAFTYLDESSNEELGLLRLYKVDQIFFNLNESPGPGIMQVLHSSGVTTRFTVYRDEYQRIFKLMVSHAKLLS